MKKKLSSAEAIKERYKFENSFGMADLSQDAQTVKIQSQEELLGQLPVSDEKKRELTARRTAKMNDARLNKKNQDSELTTRMTFIVYQSQLDKIKEIAYLKRSFCKDIVARAFQDYIDKYEAAHGTIIIPDSNNTDEI